MALRNRELGQRIKAAREQAGLTQLAFALAMHYSPGSVSRWENGRNTPDMETLMQIADVLGRPVSYFTAALDRPVPSNNGDGPADSTADALRSLEEQVSMLRRIVEELREEMGH